MHPTHVPLRIATGAYILNSGIGKLKATEEEAEQAHGWASSVYPFLKDMKSGDFHKALAYGEIGLGAALLSGSVGDVARIALICAFAALSGATCGHLIARHARRAGQEDGDA